LSSSWGASFSHGGPGGGYPPPLPIILKRGLYVTPLLDNFDPTDLSWNDLYSLTWGTSAFCWKLDLEGMFYISAGGSPPESCNGLVELGGTTPGIITLRRDAFGGVRVTWNAYDEVFGFVVSLWQDGGTVWTWTGALGNSDTRVYALREWCTG